jgi:hypothetical protein
MLPDADYSPSSRVQTLVGVSVALHIGRKLGDPPGSVGLRHGRMLRAAVPEASIHVYDDASPGEYDVGSPAQPWQWGDVYAVPQTSTPQLPPE